MHPNEITIEQIGALNPIQLTKLLHSLVRIELTNNGMSSTYYVPLNINAADAGEDGRAHWSGGPERTERIHNRLTVFQSKATNLMPEACYEEILEKKQKGQPRILKSQVKDVIDNDGCYVLFTNRALNTRSIANRIKRFREAIKDTGHSKHDTCQIQVYDANYIKDWCNKNIQTVTQVQADNNITRPVLFRTWKEFEKTLKFSNIPYERNKDVDSYCQLIIAKLKQEKVIRIVGHSGLGKTRLVLETFRSSNSNSDIQGLQDQLVYFDAALSDSGATDVYTYITCNQNQDGIIVVDNCDDVNHTQLSDLVSKISNFKLITIGFVPIKGSSSYIKIDRQNQFDIVGDIVNRALGPQYIQAEKDYVAKLSEGYPLLAIKFCESIIHQNIRDLTGIRPDQFTEKLLFNDPRGQNNSQEYKVMRGCSIFSAFAFPEDGLRRILDEKAMKGLKEQLEFIRTRVCDSIVSYNQFYEICQKYREKGLIEKRGVHYIVKPTALAITLAADWLINTPSDTIIEIIEAIQGNELAKEFAERLTDLDQIEKAVDIVSEKWGPNGSFGKAEVLNTSWGSLLFRYVVEVNPLETSKTLVKAFGNSTREQLLEIKDGRRNLVWALEKLCFRKESFENATKILYAFATAENESWGNNATNQFVHLFQIYLSGTCVDLKERFKLIQWGLAKNDPSYTKVALTAIGRGLQNDRFTRVSGAEQQGSQLPIKDYHPKPEEIITYWRELLELITGYAVQDNELATYAKKQLTNSIRTLIRDGLIKEVDSAIRHIHKKDTVWLEALDTLKMTLHFNEGLDEGSIKQINSLIELLTPVDVRNQLLLKVIRPEWHSYEKVDGKISLDKPKRTAEEFAEYLVAQNVKIEQFLNELLQGEIRQGFNFGVKLGQILKNKKEFIGSALQVLQQIDPPKQNADFISGLLIGANDQNLFDYTIETSMNIASISHQAFFFTRVSDPKYKAIERLFPLLEKYSLSIKLFKNFQYGRALDKLSPEEVDKLTLRIAEYEITGRWTALSLIHSYCFENKERFITNADTIEKIITGDNMLLNVDQVGSMDTYYWSNSISAVISNTEKPEFANKIAKQVVEACAVKDYNYGFDVDIENTLRLLVKRNFDAIWEPISEGLLSDDFYTVFHLGHVVGTRDSWNGGNTGILFENEDDNEKILLWCKKYPNVAPKRIAKFVPKEANPTGDKVAFHPMFLALLDNFGQDKEVLDALNANLGTFGTMGSVVPHYERQKKLLETVKNHPIPLVRQWVESMISYTEKTIELSRIHEEERM